MNAPDRIYEYLLENGKQTNADLVKKFDLFPKQVTYALKKLMRKGKIIKIPNLSDMRSIFYEVY